MENTVTTYWKTIKQSQKFFEVVYNKSDSFFKVVGSKSCKIVSDSKHFRKLFDFKVLGISSSSNTCIIRNNIGNGLEIHEKTAETACKLQIEEKWRIKWIHKPKL